MIAIVVIHVASWQIRMLMITMMTIVLSVSGLYFANPKSTYFSLGKIQKDQVGQRDVVVPMIWLLGWKIEHDGYDENMSGKVYRKVSLLLSL